MRVRLQRGTHHMVPPLPLPLLTAYNRPPGRLHPFISLCTACYMSSALVSTR